MSEEARGFLQLRVALVGKIVLAIALIGIAAEAAVWPVEQMTQPAFVLLAAGAIFPAVQWLTCRTGQRSAAFIRGAEAIGLLGTAACVAVAGRFLVAEMMRVEYGRMTDDAGLSALFISTQFHISASVGMGLGFVAVLRAALVPSRPLYTAAYTVVLGLPLIAAFVVGPEWFGWLPPLPVDSMPTGARPWHGAAAWWVATVIVCTAISRIIYGLRQEVAAAKQLGQYTLEAKIGEGGMGVVYRARHSMMQRPTAIKLLTAKNSSEAMLKRFEREVQLTTRLTHPNTITIYDYGRTPDGVFYYAMELLDGATLEQVVNHDGGQPPERVVAVLIQLAGALEEAHGIELIHRDIKPSNIILCTRGGKPDVAKLLDFGLVKQIANTEDESKLTGDTSVMGTPMYMPPEAITHPESIDARSDLYALGAVGYYLLTGEDVFEGKNAVEICGHHMHTEPQPPSSRTDVHVPQQLDKLLLRCLEKDQDDRPQSARELLDSLAECELENEWTRERAEKWWADTRIAMVVQSDRTISHTHTIAVDLKRRK